MKEDEHTWDSTWLANDMEVKALRRKGKVYTIEPAMGRQIALIHYTEKAINHFIP